MKKESSGSSGKPSGGRNANRRAIQAETRAREAGKQPAEMPLHRAIYEKLLAEIQSGIYKPGQRLPPEVVLCERFHASRITVAKAFQSLQRDNLVRRRPGSGTYVEKTATSSSHKFGVLIPGFGTTDVFEPICQGIMRSPLAQSHSLTWGATDARATNSMQVAEGLCRLYIAERVSGVFFAPRADFSGGHDEANHRIASMLERAGIPVVLLDRDFHQYPDRSNFDLVGIDNRRAGFLLTRHLIRAGAERIAFAMRRNSSSTMEARAAGYMEALSGLRPSAKPIIFCTDFSDPDDVKQLVEKEQPDGIVCATDLTAARIMGTLVSMGLRIPQDIRMVGVDDVNYAKFLPTPLTTLRQNCAEIGAAAMATMLDRLKNPNQPARDVLVRCDLIVRASCGTGTAAGDA